MKLYGVWVGGYDGEWLELQDGTLFNTASLGLAEAYAAQRQRKFIHLCQAREFTSTVVEADPAGGNASVNGKVVPVVQPAQKGKK